MVANQDKERGLKVRLLLHRRVDLRHDQIHLVLFRLHEGTGELSDAGQKLQSCENSQNPTSSGLIYVQYGPDLDNA